jgi:hypothetical protein
MKNEKYIKALRLKYQADMAEADAALDLYLSADNLAAIGEHSDLLEEQDKWITKYTDAKGKLESLESYNTKD